jgi:hypothetical protein
VEDAAAAKDVPYPIGGKMPPATVLYKIKCEALVEYIGTEEDEDDIESYLDSDGHLASRYHEGWVVYRSIKDFQAFHKQLKSEVASRDSTGSLLVGAATAAFGASGVRKRKVLVPSLASKTGGLAVTRKAITKRGELLSEYLEDLISPNNLVNRCMELLLFLGASQPFPPEVKVGQMPGNFVDPLGRSAFFRSIALKSSNGTTRKSDSSHRPNAVTSQNNYELSKSSPKVSLNIQGTGSSDWGADLMDAKDALPAVLNKVDQVPLELVRNRIIDLGRYWFGFENASFFRSQILAALETASFVAMTKASSFRNLLYSIHLKYLNPDALAGWIQKVLDTLWPDGVWMTTKPPYTEEEEIQLREKSREKLHEVFPEQIGSILGQDLAEDGLDMLHEMLQNRIVVKSLFYMCKFSFVG